MDKHAIIEVTYENGVLRPLEPLSLPEHARVQIQIVGQETVPVKDIQRVREALLAAGVIRVRSPLKVVEPVSEDQLAAAAETLAVAGPLPEQIIVERNGR